MSTHSKLLVALLLFEPHHSGGNVWFLNVAEQGESPPLILNHSDSNQNVVAEQGESKGVIVESIVPDYVDYQFKYQSIKKQKKGQGKRK